VLGSGCSMVIKRPGWESYDWGLLLGGWLLATGLGSALALGGCCVVVVGTQCQNQVGV